MKNRLNNKNGFTLIESLLAMFLMAMAGAAILSALAVGSHTNLIGNEQATAESLARSQLELIKSSPFSISHNYPQLENVPPYWNVIPIFDAAPDSTMGQMQKIKVDVLHSGKMVLSITTYKAYAGY